MRAIFDQYRRRGKTFTPQERQEIRKLVDNFITRAGQQFSGPDGLTRLKQAVEHYCRAHETDPDYKFWIAVHKIAYEVYVQYQASLDASHFDFNTLMSEATLLFQKAEKVPAQFPKIRARASALKYLMIDEYQDFSDLFFALTVALRHHCPQAKLFAVGDDWQAINRFAGSDCDYFLRFGDYFPEDNVNIPLATNYRSCRRIVENANAYMLANYNPNAIPAIAHNKRLGRIYRLNPDKTSFNAEDVYEDGLGDGRFQNALSTALADSCQLSDQTFRPPDKFPASVLKLLKQVARICRKHSTKTIMLLHRHNHTSFDGIFLTTFMAALEKLLIDEAIFTADNFSSQIRAMTMHKSKGLESDIVILLEANRSQILSTHPYAQVFEIFGDNLAAESADQQRLLYVAMTRAKEKLYILSTDQKCPL